jgi:hypothetical protein
MGWFRSVESTASKGSTADHGTGRREFGRNPRRSTSSRKAAQRAFAEMRRSTRVGILLYIGSTEHLTQPQKSFLAHAQGRLNSEEINRAIRVCSRLQKEERYRARLRISDLSVPAETSAPRRRTPRRIGIGYRDKGSLRPSHRPVLPAEDRPETMAEELLTETIGGTHTHRRLWDRITESTIRDSKRNPAQENQPEPFLPLTEGELEPPFSETSQSTTLRPPPDLTEQVLEFYDIQQHRRRQGLDYWEWTGWGWEHQPATPLSGGWK